MDRAAIERDQRGDDGDEACGVEQKAHANTDGCDQQPADRERRQHAEELRGASGALGEIIGTESPDELLGRIFASFCIGK